MEAYKKEKNELESKTKIKMSSLGYALRCDYAIMNTTGHRFTIDTLLMESVPDNGSIFIRGDISNLSECLSVCCEILKKNNRKVNWYILWEPITPTEVIQLLKPYTNHFFLSNNYDEDPMIHLMPLGIRDGVETHPTHKNFSQQYLLDEKIKKRSKEYLCFLCFSNTHTERSRCEAILGNCDYVYNINKENFPPPETTMCGKVPLEINYQKTHESKYVLAPRGYGEATHRFFEAIFLNSIPIVKKTNTKFDRLYEIFPCLIVDDWVYITEEMLESNYDQLKKKLDIFWETYPNAFQDLVSIDDLLLHT